MATYLISDFMLARTVVAPTTSQVSGFDFQTKLNDPQPRHRGRVAATSGTLALDAGGANTNDFAALISTNLSTNARLRFRGSTVDGSAPSNRLLQARTFTDAAWTKTNVTINSAGTVSDPFGGSGASKLAETAVNAVHEITQSLTLTDNQNCFVSAYVDPVERTWCFLWFRRKDNTIASRYFNLSGGGSLGTGSNDSGATITAVGAYYRVGFYASSLSGGTAPVIGLGLATADLTNSYLGTAGSGANIDGLMIDYDTSLNTFVTTTSAAVVPAVDTGFTTQITTHTSSNGNVIATFAPTSFRYGRWDWTGGPNPTDIGLAPWGNTQGVAQTYNPQYGAQRGIVDYSIRSVNPDNGSHHYLAGPVAKTLTAVVDMPDTNAERNWLDGYYPKTLGDLLLIIEPDASETNPWFYRAQRCIWGPSEMPGTNVYTHHFQSRAQKPFQFLERI